VNPQLIGMLGRSSQVLLLILGACLAVWAFTRNRKKGYAIIAGALFLTAVGHMVAPPPPTVLVVGSGFLVLGLWAVARWDLVRARSELARNPVVAAERAEQVYERGKGTYGSPRVHAWGEGAVLRVGSYCSIADGVQIYLGGEHRTDWVSTFPFSRFSEAARQIPGHPATKGDVTIGHDVWIGAEAVILSGISIGSGAVIGARAVVTRDVPPYAVAAGNPARVVRERFDEQTVQRLLAIRWWEWEDDRIEKALPMLLNPDISAFLDAAEAEAI
jgi:chloramphenicol O-acetyltransferase type B